MRKDGSSTLRPESLRKTNRASNAPVNVRWGACPEPVEGLRVDWGAARNAVRGMLKHGSSKLRPESLRKNNRAFNAPVNVQEGLREDSGRSEERGGEACSNTAPPRSALNPCGKQPRHSMRRSMFRREPALSLST